MDQTRLVHYHFVKYIIAISFDHAPFETGEGDAVFSVFIDNWSIPKKDIDIYLRKGLHYCANPYRHSVASMA